MKKISLAVVGLATLGVLSFGQSAHAEETTANVKVNSGGIKISDVTNINFNDVTVSKGGTTTTEKDKSTVSIEDLRGSSSKGWTLTAQLKDNNFKGMSLNVVPKIEANTEVAEAGTKATLNSSPQMIATVSDEKVSSTEFDTNVSLNATLDVPAKQLSNTYTTTIVWNLAEGPVTQ
ncbi:WxL domain-containing protein [Lactococcus petauri]|uniref:WxL domain-containing protein n=1 Tax=Lactococcus petauri TaxID=1940789 RepID=UPI00254C32B7|nr:WxL domain-containing protein [Lactococcus petauri]